MKAILESLKKLSKLIMENKDELYNIDTRSIILDEIENIGVNIIKASINDVSSQNECKSYKSIRNLLNSLTHDLILNNTNPDIGLKMCSDIGLILAALDS